MLLKLILAFTLIPVAEIYVLIELGGAIGALNTIAVVILTAVAGGYLARMQGTKTYLQIRRNLDQGIMPTEELLDALIILVAGVVLLTPGFITDAAGLLLLIPATRQIVKRRLKRSFEKKTASNRITIDIDRF
jgi:UPF0716 protein FxsA